MRIFLILVLTGGLFATILGCGIEEGWKGILVFMSNRADVEKVLGPATDEGIDDGTVDYQTDDALVHVIYAFSPCSEDKRGRGRFNVPKDTVIWYWVVLKKEIELTEFKYKPQLYKRVPDIHKKDLTEYINARDGISFSTINRNGKEMVWGIYYDRTVEMTEKNKCKKT